MRSFVAIDVPIQVSVAIESAARVFRCAVLLSPHLKSLCLSGNKISEIDNVAGLTDLTTLDLSRNEIEVRIVLYMRYRRRAVLEVYIEQPSTRTWWA